MSLFFFLMIRRPPRSTLDRSSAASDVYKRQGVIDINLKLEQPFLFGRPILTTTELFLRSQTVTEFIENSYGCLLYTSPSPRDRTRSRMPSSA